MLHIETHSLSSYFVFECEHVALDLPFRGNQKVHVHSVQQLRASAHQESFYFEDQTTNNDELYESAPDSAQWKTTQDHKAC